MELTYRTHDFEITDRGHIGTARRRARQCGAVAGLDAAQCERLALIVTEAAANIAEHAGGGQLLIGSRAGRVDVWALDRGPGMTNIARCMEDGYSSRGTAGTGLGAIARLSDAFALRCPAGVGTILWSQVMAHPTPPGCGVGICAALAGQTDCGDAWWQSPDRCELAVIDGLGHGTPAAVAARTALDALERGGGSPSERLQQLHTALRGTRGAAVAIVKRRPGAIEFAGLGNVSAVVLRDDSRDVLMSTSGVVGESRHAARPREAAFAPGDQLVLATDGLRTGWMTADLTGWQTAPPEMVAGRLFCEFQRRTDDTCVVVLPAGEDR